MSELYHFIDGKRVAGKSGRFGPVYNATTGEEAAQVPLANVEETREAIASAARAFPDWAAQSPVNRARVMFKFKELLEANMEELATVASEDPLRRRSFFFADSHPRPEYTRWAARRMFERLEGLAESGEAGF